MLIDTHCHIYYSEVENAEEIIKECKKDNIVMILNGIDKILKENSIKNVELHNMDAGKFFEKELKTQKKYKEKIRIKLGKGEKTLPITHGDVIAFKFIEFCIIIVMFFFFILWLV